MAVNTGNDNKPMNNSQMGEALSQAAKQTQQQTGPMDDSHHKGLMQFASSLGAPMGRFSTSENVVAVRDAIQESMNKHFDKESVLNEYKIFAADKDKEDIGNVSCVIVCKQEMFNGNVYVAFNILIIEKTAPTLSTQPANIDGHTYEEIKVTGDLYDTNMAARAEALVVRHFGNDSRLKVLEAGHEVIPSETDISDDEVIHQITFNSVMACFSVLEETKDGSSQKLFSISEIDRQNELLTINLDYSPGKVESFTGDPIRSDIAINLQSKQATNNNEMFERVTPIGRLDGYVDLIYSPPAPAQPGYPQATQHFYPRFIITRMDSELNINTIPLQLLNLAQSNILAYNSAWMGAFKPRHHVKGVDPRDVGAIGYEVPMTNDPNVFEKVDTKTQEFNEVSFYQFMKTYFHDTPIISLDVEETGELSWLNDVFVSAGMGNPEAIKTIVESADVLTSGFFSQVWEAGEICSIDNRIHLGYYTDENGERCDIRELDYLAVMNIAGKDDKTLVERWEASFSQTNIAPVIRMEDRAKIISAFLSGAKVKSYAQRVNFSPYFLSALLDACSRAGLMVQPQNVYQSNTAGMNRGYTNAANMALQYNQQANAVFNQGGNQSGGWTAHRPYTGRFHY